MSDLSDIQITLTHDAVEEVIRKELRDAIRCHKKEINNLDKDKVCQEHEDLLYSKAFIRAAAIILRYYTVHGTKEWKELDEISD